MPLRRIFFHYGEKAMGQGLSSREIPKAASPWAAALDKGAESGALNRLVEIFFAIAKAESTQERQADRLGGEARPEARKPWKAALP
jgi:hypothetical protein